MNDYPDDDFDDDDDDDCVLTIFSERIPATDQTVSFAYCVVGT